MIRYAMHYLLSLQRSMGICEDANSLQLRPAGCCCRGVVGTGQGRARCRDGGCVASTWDNGGRAGVIAVLT